MEPYTVVNKEKGKSNEQYILFESPPVIKTPTKISKKKYEWKIGCPPPAIDKHSQTKHAILEEYVRRYIYRLTSNASIPKVSLSIIDGFSGGGEYISEDGINVDGSPILMMKAVREARFKININRNIPREVSVQYSFIDQSESAIEYLKRHVDQQFQENLIDKTDYKQISYHAKPFFEVLPNIKHRIRAHKGGERAIFILDQFAYKDVPLPKVRNLLESNRNSEVIMTFNIDNMITYLSEVAPNKKAINNIGLDSYIPWEDLSQIKSEDSQRWRSILQRYIANGIKIETGAGFMNLFFVKPQGANTWGYWLIHLSNHYRAHEVMKTIHWEHATDFSHELEPGHFVLGYNTAKDVDYTGQTAIFGESSSNNACINGLREHFGTTIFTQENITVSELYSTNIGNSMGSETHLNKAVSQLHRQKDVVIFTKDGISRRPSKSYNSTDIISSRRQYGIW